MTMADKTQARALDGIAVIMAVLTVLALLAMIFMNPVAAIGTALFFVVIYKVAAWLFG